MRTRLWISEPDKVHGNYGVQFYSEDKDLWRKAYVLLRKTFFLSASRDISFSRISVNGGRGNEKNLFRCTYYSKEGCCAPVGESVVLCDVCEHTDNSPPSNESEKQNNPYEEEKLIKDALPSETYAHYGRFGSIKRGRKL